MTIQAKHQQVDLAKLSLTQLNLSYKFDADQISAS
ncbi:hypothetical protein EYZ11_007304 [Aspergillus tanneri]|uniref:Uncharacterized protein n=1 Tax=Aspergillus tanneri TaxID=1220188 RepID=A0A4S3JDP2_9EURO|nr:hypothetical protein EYZ11_007304 [Aspergillus tanneri]